MRLRFDPHRLPWSPASIIVAAFVVMVSVIAALTTPSGQAPQPTASGTPSVAPSASSVESATPAPSVEATAETLSKAVVYIEVSGAEGAVSGSGTIVSADGLILTNAHVVAPFGSDDVEISVGLTRDTDQAPKLEYAAEVVAADPTLDLAVLRLTETLDGDPIDTEFFYLPVGDSDAVALGETLQVLGYPGIGGGTITYTSGQVSGFTGDAMLGERAWIKTDAVIAGGNSGGLAANERGEVIGVPTQAAASANGPVVDCRIITDTNGDMSIDADDSCVPIGGFLNGIRPVAFADDMLAAARAGTAYQPIGGAPTTPTDEDIESVSFRPAVMSTDVDTATNTAVDRVEWLPSGSTQVCAVWEYEGMQAGMHYDAIWLIDGEIDPDISYLSQTWGYEAAGSFWICAYAEDGGLRDGQYTAAILVEGDYQASGWVFIGDEYAPASWTLENNSSLTFCYVFISPQAAPTYGQERLGEERLLEPGDALDLELTPGKYDVLIRDCDLEEIYAETVQVEADGILSLSD